MPFRIQRAPRGLNNLLSIFGGDTPIELEDRVRGGLELLQFYGLQQRQVVFGNNAALAEAGTVQATGTALTDQYCILFGASFGGLKTATMTAFRVSIEMVRAGAGANSIGLASGDLGPFGATESGPAAINFWAPYPILLVPPWQVFGRLQILGTDANANMTCIAELGVLQ